MPYFLIPPTLGICFAFVWTFIAAMIVREGQLAVRREREEHVVETPRRKPLPIPQPHFGRERRSARRRAG